LARCADRTSQRDVPNSHSGRPEPSGRLFYLLNFSGGCISNGNQIIYGLEILCRAGDMTPLNAILFDWGKVFGSFLCNHIETSLLPAD
jgi:hypothetical protein